MTQLRTARFSAHTRILRELFLGYIEALCTEMPDNRSAITQKYSPEAVDAWLVDFERLHSPPYGNLLIAWHEETPLACGMLRTFAPSIADIRRLYIPPPHAAGAIKLYQSLGFKERSPYHNLTPQMDHFIVYSERPL